jgi:hypothetical protein
MDFERLKSLIRERDLMDRKLIQIRWLLPLSGIASLGVLAFVVLTRIINLTTGDAILDYLIANCVPALVVDSTALYADKKYFSTRLERVNREIRQFDEIVIS